MIEVFYSFKFYRSNKIKLLRYVEKRTTKHKATNNWCHTFTFFLHGQHTKQKVRTTNEISII